MKALTIRQPWASLVAIGAKRIETRSWATNYRGVLCIHSSKNILGQDLYICYQEPFLSALMKGGIDLPGGLPLGRIIATARLVDCERIDDWRPGKPELDFGWYENDRYAWFFEDVDRLEVSVPARGSLGLWEVTL